MPSSLLSLSSTPFFVAFPDIQADPLATVDQVEYDKWLARHKKNLLLDAPLEDTDDED